MQYWAKIEEHKITFYTETYLWQNYPEVFYEIKRMQDNWRKYKKNIKLSQEKVEKLKARGIEVLRPEFLALDGKWHWFTGYSNMDAFRLSWQERKELDKEGKYTVWFDSPRPSSTSSHSNQASQTCCQEQKLTLEQKEISEAKFENYDVLIVNAYAGTGKTFTLQKFVENVKKASPEAKILYLAFNRSVCNEAQKRFKEIKVNVDTYTFHSFAWHKLKLAGTRPNQINNKNNLTLKNIIDQVDWLKELKKSPDNTPCYLIAEIIKELLEGFCRSSANSVREFCQSKNENIDSTFNYLAEEAQRLFDNLSQTKNSPHCIYLKKFELCLKNNKEKEWDECEDVNSEYDFVLVDEVQDLNEVMISILKQLSKPKIVLIGDEFQHIYAWNGAINTFDKLEEIPRDQKPSYLTESFRCGEQPAKCANQWLKLIHQFTKKEFKNELKPRNGSISKGMPEKAFLARTNKTIFEKAVECIDNGDNGISCYIEGFSKTDEDGLFNKRPFNKFLSQLEDIVHLKKGIRSKIKDEFIKGFKDFSQLKKYAITSQNIELLGQIELVNDQFENLMVNIDKLRKSVKENKNEANLVLSTVHQAKGLEFKECELADDFRDYIKHRVERNGDISLEELNLIYVAITRAAEKVKADFLETLEKELLSQKDKLKLKNTFSLNGLDRVKVLYEILLEELEDKIWAEIDNEKIAFFTEKYLISNDFDKWKEIKIKQAQWQLNGRDVEFNLWRLPRVLEDKGLKVKNQKFKAIDGKWRFCQFLFAIFLPVSFQIHSTLSPNI